MITAITHAFQPIVDSLSKSVFAYEALARGVDGSPPHQLFSNLAPAELREQDLASRLGAIALAAKLNMSARISVNAMPWGMEEGGGAELLARHANDCSFPLRKIIVEVTESEIISDIDRFTDIVSGYRRQGIQLALDDFGAGYSGLSLLADFQPDIIKLDMNLVRGIESRGARQSIVRAIVQVCEDLGIEVIAEGVETVAEYRWFRAHNVTLFQGFLIARPGLECLPDVSYPE